MQIGPGGMGQPMRGHPDQLVQALMPIVNDAMRVFDSGATLPSVLRETAAAAYLVGRGMTPAQAMETVMQWRVSGTARSLIRTQRTPGEFAPSAPMAPTPAPAAPTAAPTAPATAPMSEPPGEATGSFQPEREQATMTDLVEQFMRNEATAAAFYQQLIDAVEDPFVKDYIRHAMEDEQKHYRMLGGLYREMTGRTYEARPEPQDVSDLVAALRHAMSDEYEATEEYRDVYLRSMNPRVRNLFFELMTDELEHATRFNYALQTLGR